MVIAFEIVTALALFSIALVQRPGTTSRSYARKHGREEIQIKQERAAKNAETQLGEEHAVARLVLFKGGGIALWGGGLCLVIVSTPHVFNPNWVNRAVVGFGLLLQLVATTLVIVWGIVASRRISKAVRAQTDQGVPREPGLLK